MEPYYFIQKILPELPSTVIFFGSSNKVPSFTWTLERSIFLSKSDDEISTKPPLVSYLLSKDVCAIQCLELSNWFPLALIAPLKSVISSDQTIAVPALPCVLETFILELIPTIVCLAFLILGCSPNLLNGTPDAFEIIKKIKTLIK